MRTEPGGITLPGIATIVLCDVAAIFVPTIRAAKTSLACGRDPCLAQPVARL